MRSEGWYVAKVADSRPCDLIAWDGNHVMFVEVKATKRKPTPSMYPDFAKMKIPVNGYCVKMVVWWPPYSRTPKRWEVI